ADGRAAWREQRLNEDPRRSDSAGLPQPSPNNTTGSGSIGLTDANAVGGECAKGFSEETCRRRGQEYNPTADFNLPMAKPLASFCANQTSSKRAFRKRANSTKQY